MKKVILMFLLFLPLIIKAERVESDANFSCNWDFNFNYTCGTHYNAGHNLYVKANPNRYQDIDWMELYVNNQFVRKESSYPYEWARPNTNGDSYLRNMQAGTYTIKIKVKDRCGQYHEKTCVVYIDGHNGGNNGGHCNWQYNYNIQNGKHYNAGHNLYLKGEVQKYQDVDWIELYCNNQLIRKETNYPYEWGKPNSNGDNYLKNMQPGTYNFKMKMKDRCGQYHEKLCIVYIDPHHGGNTGGHCTWDFNYNFNCGTHYNAGHNLYVKANPTKHQDIDWMELYLNNQLVRKETSYPYEWARPNSSGDNYLRNMQAGTYTLKIKVKDKCGQYHEKTCVVYIDGHNGGNTGGHCTWNSDYQYPQNTNYPNHTNLYVKVDPDKYQDIEWMELYINNQFVRKETQYPYEWAKPNVNGDNYLKNLSPGTYNLKCKIKDKCGQYHEKIKTIYVQN